MVMNNTSGRDQTNPDCDVVLYNQALEHPNPHFREFLERKGASQDDLEDEWEEEHKNVPFLNLMTNYAEPYEQSMARCRVRMDREEGLEKYDRDLVADFEEIERVICNFG